MCQQSSVKFAWIRVVMVRLSIGCGNVDSHRPIHLIGWGRELMFFFSH